MKTSSLPLLLALCAGIGFGACGGGAPEQARPADAGGGGGDVNVDRTFDGLTALVITPENAVVEATPEASGSLAYTVIGKFNNRPDADLTDKISLKFKQVMGGGEIGWLDGNTFVSGTSNGGRGTIWATVNGVTASTSVTVHFTVEANGPDLGVPLPEDPSEVFANTPDGPGPSVVYPNDRVMLPPNLNRLEIHWRPRTPDDSLFRIEFDSPTATIREYLRCTSPTDGGCIFELEPEIFRYLAESNRGGPPATLRMRASDETSETIGESAPLSVSFAERNVEGGLYYWTTTLRSIMRFDFGAENAIPETYLTPSDVPNNGCVGCHAISPDGTKLVASLNGVGAGALVFIRDISKPIPLTISGDMNQAIQFASFSPTGDRFVAIYGDTTPELRTKLWFHDGHTGRRIADETVTLSFEPDHPSWSPDGTMIAVTHVGVHNTSQAPLNSGIDLIRQVDRTWGEPETIVPQAEGLNRYNPNFSPDSKYLLYSESTCPEGNINSTECDGDADPSATTWLVLAKKDAVPVHLVAAGSGGPEDKGKKQLSDTFPRFSPFSVPQGEGRLHWVTISSRRRVGLRDPQGKQYLWMFAINADKVENGGDPSYPAFYLPFQDPNTSNHIGQWTKKVIPVGGPD